METEIVEPLNVVFATFPEPQRAQLVQWATQEVRSRSAVEMLTDDEGVVWKIATASPSNPELTVFAILFDSIHRCFDVYSFGIVEDKERGEGRLYYHEQVFRPSHAYGPISAAALYEEWDAFFNEDDDPEPGPDEPKAHANGAGA